MIRMFSPWVAAACVALAVPALAAPAATGQKATQTVLQVDTRDVNGHTEAAVSIAVTGADGLPATGAVAIYDQGKPLGGLALDAQGKATATLSLPAETILFALFTLVTPPTRYPIPQQLP